MPRLLIITEYEERHIHELISGIKKYVKEQKVKDPTICTISKAYVRSIGTKGLIGWCREWKIDCVLGAFTEDSETDLLSESGIITVNWNSLLSDTILPSVRTDHTSYGRICVNHFKSYNHFAFYSHTIDPRRHEIIDGFREVLKNKPFTSFDYFLYDTDSEYLSELDRLKKWLRSLPKPILLLAGTDVFGNNLIEYCKVLDIDVPGRVAILGIGNCENICNMKLMSLSSINMNMDSLGWRIAEMMDACLKHREFKGYDIINQPGEIIERLSTAKIPSYNPEVVKAAKYIHDNYNQRIGVDDVVSVTTLSRRVLEKQFAADCGMGIYQYILKLKLDNFAHRVMRTNEPIKNIAYSLGDTEAKNLGRMFMKKYGCAPNRWRETHTRKK